MSGNREELHGSSRGNAILNLRVLSLYVWIQSQTEEKEEEIDGDDDGDAVAPVPTTSPVSVEAMGEWFTERY